MIGLRVIKSGLAVMISALIAVYFNLSTPFFICMTAFISMERTLFTSLALGRNRVVGTAIGAIIGGALSIYFPGNSIAAGLGVMLAIKICTSLKLNGAIFISGIVCIACTLHVSNGHGVDYAFHRTVETFIGMLVSIVINLAFFPYYNITRLIEIEKEVLTALAKDNVSVFNEKMNLLKDNIDLYKDEFMSKKKKAQINQHLENYEYFNKAKLHYEMINLIEDQSVKLFHQSELHKCVDQIKI